MAKDSAHRKHLRHDTDMPIEIQLSSLVSNKKEYLVNISIGGLCFRSNSSIKKGEMIDVKIPLIRPVFTAKAEVMWCRKEKYTYLVGLKFIEPKDTFKIRMFEQVCHIENYKKEELKKTGRKLTSEEAALEWIKKYAKSFPVEQ